MFIYRSLILLLLAWVTATGQQPAATLPPSVPASPAAASPPPLGVSHPAATTLLPVKPTPGVTTPPPGVPIPGVVPPPAAGAPALKPAANVPAHAVVVPLGETKIIEDIIEPKLSGNALAGLYRKYTGRRVIVSAAASIAEFSFVQDASAQDPLTYAKAAELLKKAATIESFVFVPDDQDTNLDILTLSTGGIRPTGRGVEVYNENSPLPDGDAVISYVMTLSYIKPAEAVNTFTQIIGQFGSYGSIAAVPNAAAVVITENTSLIRKLIDLKKEIDKPSSQVATRFIKVTFADVTEIATTLTELLTAQQSNQKTAGVQRAAGAAAAAPAVPAPAGLPAAAPVGGAVAGQPGGTSSGEDNPVQIIPEPRTNRIFAMGRPVDLLFVEGLIHEFDVPTSDKTFLRRKLRFLTVSDFLPIASNALTRAFSGGDSGGGGAAAGGAKPKSAQSSSANSGQGSRSGSGQGSRGGSSSSGFGGNSSSGFGGSSGGSFGGGSSGGMGGSSGGGGLSASNVSAAPESMLVGRTLLVADNITNSIVAQGPPSGLEIIERLLEQIDVKPDQVMISTIIGQLTLDDTKAFGMDYFGIGGDLATHAGGGGLDTIIAAIIAAHNGTTAPTTLVDPITGVLAGTATAPLSGLHMYGKIGGNLNAYLQALQSKTDFTVLSRPSIFTSNNQKGTISSGERIAIPTGSTSYGSSNNASTQIQYQDVVLKLEVIPLVNSDKEITMQISLLNDEQNAVPQLIKGGAGGGGDLSVPSITTREILTTATVPNNETIVLGGLIVGKGGESKSGIPILSDIPYLGRLFATTNNSKHRSELMVFIQPSIVSSARSLGDVQSSMDSRYKVSSDARNFAEGTGVLPGEKASPQVETTGKNATSSKAEAPLCPPATTHMKPSIRPANLR